MRCEECDKVDDSDAAGWRAYLAYDPREDPTPFVALYCPACAEREFDPRDQAGGQRSSYLI